MNHFLMYRLSTGEATGTYDGPLEQAHLQLQPGEGFALAEEFMSDVNAYYDLSAGVAVFKAHMPLQIHDSITADGQDEAVITGIPAGVSVTWPDGQTDEVTDGEVRFSVDLAGTYHLKFTAVEYLDKEVTIEAVPAA